LTNSWVPFLAPKFGKHARNNSSKTNKQTKGKANLLCLTSESQDPGNSLWLFITSKKPCRLMQTLRIKTDCSEFFHALFCFIIHLWWKKAVQVSVKTGALCFC
jgi:hypothetical protein